MIAAGDATANTFAAINDILDGIQPLNVQMLTMPHHGSFRTTYALVRTPTGFVGDGDTAFARAVVERFVGLLRPRTISVSASIKTYRHPSLTAVEQFARFTDPAPLWSDPETPGRHFVSMYLDRIITPDGATPQWPETKRYATTETATNIYPTLYFLNDPYNQGAPGRKRSRDGDGADAVIYLQRYVCPPLGSAQIRGVTPTVDVTTGMSWYFTYTANGVLTVSDAPNPLHTDPTTTRLRPVEREAPVGVTTGAGRLTRAAALAVPARREEVPA
ncbi:MAG: hypothetical protein HQL40_14825 [Alphaproteobacteria bacterium]|nr:hypothetical protein [Alphaproteobacteria bacterium]